MNKIKDLCLFQCFTGLRISDLKRLNRAHIKEDASGNFAIRIEAFKTGKKIFIPLREEAMNILIKHNYKLPTCADAHYNREIKKLLEYAGVNRLHEWLTYDEQGKKKYEMKPLYELFTNHCCSRSAIYYF